LAILPRRNLLLQLPAITYLWNVLESEKLQKPGEYLETLCSFTLRSRELSVVQVAAIEDPGLA